MQDNPRRRKRAGRACGRCRVRKVRCDLVHCCGSACTNCRLDEAQCVEVVPRRRGTCSRTEAKYVLEKEIMFLRHILACLFILPHLS